MTALIAALITVESGGNDFAKGDYPKWDLKKEHPRAIGCLQIHREALSDVNRIYHTKYTWPQLTNRAISIDVCTKYLEIYAKNRGNETKAKTWNMGSGGINKPAAEVYWKKVKKALDKKPPTI